MIFTEKNKDLKRNDFADNNGRASPGEMKYAVEWRPIFYPKS